MRQRAAAVVIGVDGVSDFNALHSGKHNEKYSSARPMCLRWTATTIWMRFRASAPYRTDRVGRTRSAANGEGALLPKLLIFFRYGQAGRETIQGVLGAEPRVHKDGDGRATRQSCRGCMAMKGCHQMPYKNLRNSASILSASD
jgi:hypothetical protein